MATDDKDWRRAVARDSDSHDAALSSLWPGAFAFTDAAPPESDGRPLPAAVLARAGRAGA